MAFYTDYGLLKKSFSVVVSGGIGQTSLGPVDAECWGRLIIPPAGNAPNYQYYISDQDGDVSDSNEDGGGVQRFDGFTILFGTNLIFHLINATADGTYFIRLWLKKRK